LKTPTDYLLSKNRIGLSSLSHLADLHVDSGITRVIPTKVKSKVKISRVASFAIKLVSLPETASREYKLMLWYLRQLSVNLSQKRSHKPWVLDSQDPGRVNVSNQILGYILTIQMPLLRPVTLSNGQTLCHTRMVSSCRDILVSYTIVSPVHNVIMCQTQVNILVAQWYNKR